MTAKTGEIRQAIMGGNRLVSATFGTAALMLVGAAAEAFEYSAKLSGFAEVPAAILSNGRGTVGLDLDKRAGTLTYSLTYSGLGSAVTQAHIHFGKIHVAGGIIVFFCSNLPNPPFGTPACPPNGGMVTGTVRAGSVVGPAAQNIPTGSFDGLVAALVSDTAYANVHTVISRPGKFADKSATARRTTTAEPLVPDGRFSAWLGVSDRI